MKNILLYPNPTRDLDLQITRKCAHYLHQLGFTVHMRREYEIDAPCEYYTEVPRDVCDLMIVIGGDGTMIDALPTAISMDFPVLGINLGKVGYLNEIEPTELSLLNGLCDGIYSVEERLLLEVEINEENRHIDYPIPILNDLVVSRKIENTIASFRVLYNGTKALDYRADGVVISTPLGSTAYALSCGGPMLAHELNAISMTPICPHSFLNRSMVFPDSGVIEIQNLSLEPLAVIADGRAFAELSGDAICKVKRSPKVLKMISLKGEGRLQNIFRKLKKIQSF